jgi:regulation of enolase protein 1 (concanavalin A-like superfamily)
MRSNWYPTFLTLLALAAPAGARDDSPTVLFEEGFASELGSGWSWVREEPGAWRVEKGALVLRTLPGYLHAKRNNSKNVLLRLPPEAKGSRLAVEAFLESEPKVEFEHAGVVWYYDDDNYVALFKEVLDGKPKLQMVTEKEAVPRFAVAAYGSKGVWLRLLVSGTTVTSQYRESEKDDWQTVGRSELPAAGRARVGVMTGGAPKDAERFVRFKSFRIVRPAK